MTQKEIVFCNRNENRLMKRILVPTDFSDNALNALRYASRIAKLFDAEIYILHAYKLIQRAGSFIAIEQKMRKQAEIDIADMVDELSREEKKNTPIHTEIIKGKIIPTIAEYSKAKEIDLIVMGTQGANGLKEIFLGSTTNGVIKNTTFPLIAIPSDYQFSESPKKVVLAIDADPVNSPDTLAAFFRLIAQAEAEVHFVHVRTDDKESTIHPQVQDNLKEFDYTLHHLDGTDIFQTINTFVEEEGIDLLCMIKRDRGMLGNLLHKSVTQRRVFNSRIPLLILHA